MDNAVLYEISKDDGKERRIVGTEPINARVHRMAVHCDLPEDHIWEVLDNGHEFAGSFFILRLEYGTE